MSKKFLLLILMTGVGIADYFLLRKSNTDLKQEILKKAAMDKQEEVKFSTTLNKMTRQELLDVLRVVTTVKGDTSKIPINQIDPAFKQRVAAISKKYNIFT